MLKRALTLLQFVAVAACAGAVVAIGLAPIAAVSGQAATASANFFQDLPSYLNVGQPQQISSIFAQLDGRDVRIASFYSQDRQTIRASAMGRLLPIAAVDTEDPRFYHEGGIDLLGTVRAGLSDAAGNGGLQGGSSITQQYVKNIEVEQCEELSTTSATNGCYQHVAGDSIGRKLQELRYAVALDKRFSKSQILTGYLNIVGFGGDVYGVQAAARYYFGVDAAKVTLPQAATLIAIVNDPARLRIDQPHNARNGIANGYELTRQRRNYVLRKMLAHGDVDRNDERKAVKTPMAPKITPSPEGCSAAAARYNAGYFCDYVRDEVLHDSAFGATVTERARALDTEGLQIRTTLHLNMQRQAQAALSAVVPQTSPGAQVGGANVTVEPGTGKILSMVQNTAYSQSNAAPAGATAVDYNTDQAYGGSSGFQTGSTFKAFTLAEWLETGHTLEQSVSSNEHNFSFNQFDNTCHPLGTGSWNVSNDVGFHGDYSVLQATAESINTVFARMGSSLDLCRIAELSQAMGVRTADGMPLSEYPSMILGVNDLSPLDLASAYAGFADGGVVCTPTAIETVRTASGKSIAQTPSRCTHSIPASVAAGVEYALRGVLRGDGTATSANPHDGTPKFGKTGTTDHDVQNWLITSTTKYTNATWVGNVTGDVGLASYPLSDGANGYDAKFAISKAIMTHLDHRLGGSVLPNPPSTMIGRARAAS